MFIFVCIPGAIPAHAQSENPPKQIAGVKYVEVVRFQPGDTIKFAHQFIQPGSVQLVIDSFLSLVEGKDYIIDYRFGKLIPDKFILDSLHRIDSARARHVLTIEYRALPFFFAEKYQKRELVLQRDDVRGDSIEVSMPSTPLNIESIFGSDLQKNGYLGRGISIGTDRDLTVTSGFRMQLSGKLSSDLDIVAALTDENTPIQPEGNTQTLQEIDKVFVQLSSPHLGATFGDFQVNFSGSEFGALNRKVKGFRGAVNFEDAEGQVSYASLRGKFQTNQFNGIDGVQGPYRLTGKNGEQLILIIAGSERVYIDGVLMTRGETQDYIIEYANGEITFKPRRLITSYARITVDFEYSDRQYARNFFAAQASTKVIPNVQVGAAYLREGDDFESPIDVALSDEDKKILENAGNDRAAASRSGITYVGYDTTAQRGAGTYSQQIDTTGGARIIYYTFDPGADSATYSLYFSFVGFGKGDYIKKTVGIFEYAEKSRGDYASIRLLPLPQMKQVGNVVVRTTPADAMQVDGEIAFNSFDQNRFSRVDEGSNNGTAYKFAFGYSPSEIKIGQRNVGALDIKVKFREANANFNPIDRINEIEFNRRWNLSIPALATEVIREGSLSFQPSKPLRLSGAYGNISRGSFTSTRTDAALQFGGDSLPRINYRFESIRSSDRLSVTNGDWTRQRGDAEYATSLLTPHIRFDQETKRSSAGKIDSLTSDSFSYIDIQPGISFAEILNMTFSADYGIRNEDIFLNGSVVRQWNSFLQRYNWRLREWQSLSSSILVTIRDKKYSDVFRALGNADFQNILTRAQVRYAPFNRGIDANLFYEVSTERTAKLEPIFLPRPIGQGDRKYVGDRNKNGIVDDSDFDPAIYGEGDWVKILVPGDQLFPVLDLKSRAQFRITPAQMINRSSSWWETALTQIASETYLRLDEKSSDERTSDIYFLRLSHFLNDSTTLRGLQTLTQDFFLFESDPGLSFRFRFDQRKGFNQFALQNERSYRREQSIRMRSRLIEEIGVQVDYVHVADAVSISQFSSRARNITSDNFIFDLSYRPEKNIEVGFVLNVKSAIDQFPPKPLDAGINSQTIRFSYSFAGQGRARAELERNEVLLKSVVDYFPFELTDGKVQGKSWIARVNIDYRITNFLQATMSYLGRVENERTAIHTARAEIRTFF